MFRIELPPTADAAELAQKVCFFTAYRMDRTATNSLLDTGGD